MDEIQMVREFIGEGKTRRALEKLSILIHETYPEKLDEFISIKSQFEIYQSKYQKGILNSEEHNRGLNQVHDRILILVSSISSQNYHSKKRISKRLLGSKWFKGFTIILGFAIGTIPIYWGLRPQKSIHAKIELISTSFSFRILREVDLFEEREVKKLSIQDFSKISIPYQKIYSLNPDTLPLKDIKLKKRLSIQPDKSGSQVILLNQNILDYLVIPDSTYLKFETYLEDKSSLNSKQINLSIQNRERDVLGSVIPWNDSISIVGNNIRLNRHNQDFPARDVELSMIADTTFSDLTFLGRKMKLSIFLEKPIEFQEKGIEIDRVGFSILKNGKRQSSIDSGRILFLSASNEVLNEFKILNGEDLFLENEVFVLNQIRITETGFQLKITGTFDSAKVGVKNSMVDVNPPRYIWYLYNKPIYLFFFGIYMILFLGLTFTMWLRFSKYLIK